MDPTWARPPALALGSAPAPARLGAGVLDEFDGEARDAIAQAKEKIRAAFRSHVEREAARIAEVSGAKKAELESFWGRTKAAVVAVAQSESLQSTLQDKGSEVRSFLEIARKEAVAAVDTSTPEGQREQAARAQQLGFAETQLSSEAASATGRGVSALWLEDAVTRPGRIDAARAWCATAEARMERYRGAFSAAEAADRAGLAAWAERAEAWLDDEASALEQALQVESAGARIDHMQARHLGGSFSNSDRVAAITAAREDAEMRQIGLRASLQRGLLDLAFGASRVSNGSTAHEPLERVLAQAQADLGAAAGEAMAADRAALRARAQETPAWKDLDSIQDRFSATATGPVVVPPSSSGGVLARNAPPMGPWSASVPAPAPAAAPAAPAPTPRLPRTPTFDPVYFGDPLPAVSDLRTRTWTRDPEASLGTPELLPSRARIAGLGSHTLCDVEADLAAARSSGRPAVGPEDGTGRPRVMVMSSADDTGPGFMSLMARIGQREGFVVAGPGGDVPGALTAEIEGSGNVWTEDGIDIGPDTAVIPRRVTDEGTQGEMAKALMEARTTRLGKDQAESFDRLGAVAQSQSWQQSASAALALGRGLQEGKSYVEQGNVLTGTDAGGEPYAVVGWDSVECTRFLLAKDLGRPVTTGQALDAIAEDYGLGRDRVFAVEQPAAFHLDMAIMLFPGRVAVVNDSREAATLWTSWIRSDLKGSKPTDPMDSDAAKAWSDRTAYVESWLLTLHQSAHVRGAIEDRTAKDLEAAGFTVHRMAGRFDELPVQRMNFLNMEQGTNPDGGRYSIHLGGDPRAEAYVAQKLLHEIPTGLDRVHFLDERLTDSTLELSGGIACRVKQATPNPP